MSLDYKAVIQPSLISGLLLSFGAGFAFGSLQSGGVSVEFNMQDVAYFYSAAFALSAGGGFLRDRQTTEFFRRGDLPGPDLSAGRRSSVIYSGLSVLAGSAGATLGYMYYNVN